MLSPCDDPTCCECFPAEAPEPSHLTITDRDNDAVKFRPGYATGSIALVVNTIHEGRSDPTRVVLRKADIVQLRNYLNEVLDA